MNFTDRTLMCRAWRRFVASFQLRPAPEGSIRQDGSLVFAVMRNEALRLPRFLEYYRRLGASGFVIVENNSNDETLGILRKQSDVLLYRTSASFVRKEAWLDLLLRRHGADRWCAVVDADELLDFPGSAELGLSGLGTYLED